MSPREKVFPVKEVVLALDVGKFFYCLIFLVKSKCDSTKITKNRFDEFFHPSVFILPGTLMELIIYKKSMDTKKETWPP